MRKPPGYWLEFENVKKELSPLIKKYGRFPSNNEMIKDVGTSLPRYIMKYHGGIIELSKKFGVKTYDENIGRKSRNTWTKEKVIEDYKRIIEERDLDYYPSRYDFKKWDLDIMIGVTQTFGTYSNFKKHLKEVGFSLDSKKKEVIWNQFKIKKTLKKIIKQLGYFPSLNELDKLGYSTLRRIVSENPNIREELILELDVTRKKRKYTIDRVSGYWNDIENIKNEVKQVYKQFGRIPTGQELIQLGYGSLSQHIKNLDSEFLTEFDYFNNSKYFQTKDGDKVLSVYELLFDNFLSFNNIKHETEGLISNETSDSYRYDFKLFLTTKPIYVEVWGYSRGRGEIGKSYVIKMNKKEQLYKKLGFTLLGIEEWVFEKSFIEIYNIFISMIQRFDPYFKPKELDLDYLLFGSKHSIKNVVNELKLIINDNDGYFPSTSQLREIHGGEGLISRIQKYGGVGVFKEMFGIEIKPSDPKWTIEFLKEEIFQINGLKYIPSLNELKRLNRLDVYGGIQQNGGSKLISKQLSIPNKLKFNKLYPEEYKGKWSQELIEVELKGIIKTIGHFPNEKELKKMNRVDLHVGIKRFGGMRKFRNKFGFKLR